MGGPFIGSEAVAAGRLTRHQLRRKFVALHRDVYIPKGTEISPVVRAKSCWMRSKRRGVLAGFSAPALHGAHSTSRAGCRSTRLWQPPPNEAHTVQQGHPGGTRM